MSGLERTDVVLTPLVADIFAAQIQITQSVTGNLIDLLTEDVARLRAELSAVRAGVNDLLNGRYMPTPLALEAALWPSRDVIDSYREEGR